MAVNVVLMWNYSKSKEYISKNMLLSKMVENIVLNLLKNMLNLQLY